MTISVTSRRSSFCRFIVYPVPAQATWEASRFVEADRPQSPQNENIAEN